MRAHRPPPTPPHAPAASTHNICVGSTSKLWVRGNPAISSAESDSRICTHRDVE